ncbi:MAG: DUF2959 domain-containing protein [Rhodothermales bacterium]
MMTPRFSRWPMLVALAALLFAGTACNRAYYRTMEAFGKDKRDLLVDRVGDARDSQEEAKEEFSSALERFSATVDFDGGDLEKTYNRLETAFERSEKRAEAVHEEVTDVADVAEALFDEWEDELDQYTDKRLRGLSEEQLEETRTEYEAMIRVMRRAEDKMDPVLNAFRDQVLFIKHNLNARAIASLEGTTAKLESDIASLIEEMEASIAEANRFIDAMQQPA